MSPQGPTVALPHAALRLFAAVGVLLLAAALFPLLVLLNRSRAERLTRWIFRLVLRAFGVRLKAHGDKAFTSIIPGRGALVVTNHVSWLDIVVINAIRPMRAMAKVEIGRWPVIGALAKRAGTVFVDREKLSTLPGTITELTEALRSGDQVNVCPEGTSWCGHTSGRFMPATFQAAIDGGVPVRPIAVRYRLADGSTTTWPAFVGDETLIDSVRRVARLGGLTVEVHVCEEIAPGRAADRRELAALSQAAVSAVLYGPGLQARQVANCEHARKSGLETTTNGSKWTSS